MSKPHKARVEFASTGRPNTACSLRCLRQRVPLPQLRRAFPLALSLSKGGRSDDASQEPTP